MGPRPSLPRLTSVLSLALPLALSFTATACGAGSVTVSTGRPFGLQGGPHVVTAAQLAEPPPRTDSAGVPLAMLEACDRGDAAACGDACRKYVEPAQLHARGDQARLAKGAGFCRKGCEGGTPAACAALGVLHLEGLGGVPQSYDTARSLLEGACGQGVLGACDNLGLVYSLGRGVPKDNQKAHGLLSNACMKGELHACANLASVIAEGWPGSPPNLGRSLDLSLSACEKGVALGCGNAAGQFAEGSIAAVADLPRAIALYRRGCDLGSAKACAYLGMHYHHAKGLPRDLTRAAELFEKSCEGGYAVGCYDLGTLFDRTTDTLLRSDDARAVELYRLACDGGEPRGCANLGVLIEHGRGTPLDLAEATRFFARGCKGGNLIGCLNEGNMYIRGAGVPVDYDKAEPLFRRVCEGGEIGGCRNLALLEWSRAGGTPERAAPALKTVEEACRKGRGPACYAAGYLLELGPPGIKADFTAALARYEKACKHQQPMACKEGVRLAARMAKAKSAPAGPPPQP